MPRSGNTRERGYGYEHQRLRKATVVGAYGKPCTRCGRLMVKGEPIDLDHEDDREGYRGYSHRSCNRAAGAEKTNTMRRQREVNPSRDW